MAASFYGELIVRYVGDTASLEAANRRALASTASSTEAMKKTWTQTAAKTGLAMQNVGRTFTQYYSLPVAAGLGYATYSAYKYQKAMIQVKELTGLTAQEASVFSDKIREASAEIGNTGGPQAAAEAYYFLASSGLNAQEAFDALRVAMKANVAGMGDIQVTADVISSAMNVYRDSSLGATEAMDILMRTIEVGKAEPTALSASLGRIMPIANQLGVDLAELGGNVAALTLGGLSSAEAVTSLRGSMVALVSPAKMSIEEMKRLGTSYQEVTRSIRDQGLLPTLKMLWDLTDHNMLAMRKIIPNVRATAGVMSLLGDNYEKNLEVIGKVADSQGKLDQTYRDAAKTDVAEFNRAMNKLKSTFIEVGAVVLPLVTEIVEVFGDLVAVFERMPDWLQKTAVGFALVSAAAFPLLSVTGSIMRAIGLVAAKRAATAAASAAEVAANAALVASNQTVAASELEVAAATTARTTSTRAAAALPTIPTGAAAGMGALGILGIGAAITAATIGAGLLINKLKEVRAAAELRATLQPEIATQQFNAAFTKAAKKSGFDKVTVDGVVYYNYTIEPKPKGGADAAGKSLVEQVNVAGKRGTERLNQLKEDTAKLVSQVQAAAYKAGGANSIMALLGQDVETNKYRGLALRPIIKNLTTDIAALELQQQKIARSSEIGKGRTNARKDDIEQLDWWISEQKRRLSGYKTMWGEVQEKMRIVQEMQPKWDYSKGLTGLRQQVKQYAFDIRQFLGQPVKMPRISLEKGDFKKQLGELDQWITHVARSRELTIRFKKERVKAGIEEITRNLNQVKARIEKTGMTAKLRADKTKLEDALTTAERKLKNLGEREPTPKVGLDTSAVSPAIDAILADLARLPSQLVIPVEVTGGKRIGRDAWGGIYRKPRITLVGEDGPEVIVPLTKPQRARQLIEESGITRYMPDSHRPLGRVAESHPAAQEPAEIHYHYENTMNLPQGLVVSDVERFGRQVQPYVERGTLLAQNRRRRGRASL